MATSRSGFVWSLCLGLALGLGAQAARIVKTGSGGSRRVAGSEVSAAVTPPAKILLKYAFESDTEGWRPEQSDYKPWSKVEHRLNGFRGSKGMLAVVSPNKWGCLDAGIYGIEWSCEDTYLSFAFRKEGAGGPPFFQGMDTGDVGQNFKSFREGEDYEPDRWHVITFDTSAMKPQMMSVRGRGRTFSSLVVVGSGARKDSAFYVDNVVLYQGKDTRPPGRVGSVKADYLLDQGAVALRWAQPEEDILVAAFDVYRSEVAGARPSKDNRVTTTAGLDVLDDTLEDIGTYYYTIVAVDVGGNRSEPSAEVAVVVD